MNKIIRILSYAAACAVATFGFSACGGENEKEYQPVRYFDDSPTTSAFDDDGYATAVYRGNILNADVTFSVWAHIRDEQTAQTVGNLWDDVVDLLMEVENSISNYIPDSSVYKFNAAAAGETVTIDKTAYEILSLAKTVYEFTDGYYNPAVWYCVDLYGFTPTAKISDYSRVSKGSRLPEEQYVSAFRELATHFIDVEVKEENGKYTAYKPADAFVDVGGKRYTMKIDLSGIGKGYAADAVNVITQKAGFEYGYFSFGSSSYAIDKFYKSESGEYSLSFVNPRSDERYGYALCKVKDEKLSTSGDHENFFIEGGTRYCHIIDPTTGSPVRTGMASCTVIGGTAAEDDALTTALIAMGKERAVNFINEKLSDRKVVFLCEQSDGLKVVTNFPEELTVAEGIEVINSVDENGKIILG